MRDRTIYLLMRLRQWSDFEPAPGCWSPFPVSIQPEGVGFMVCYATEADAVQNAQLGDKIVPLRQTVKQQP